MHIYVITRGIMGKVKEFFNFLSCQYLPFKMAGKMGGVQVSVRPIQLWEIVFPKESKDLMLTTLFGEVKGEPIHKRHKKFVSIIRRALGKDVKPIPEYDTSKRLPFPPPSDIEMVGIGIKEDADMSLGTCEGL